MTDEVKFTNEQWDALAEAAEVFAKALDEEHESLANILTTNWAGECAEGIGTIENLRMVLADGGVSSFSGAIKSESDYMRSLATQCRLAKASLSSADLESTNDYHDAS
ncbi:hypothetical protein BH683_021305 [Williamsia sp. 1138]|uniref:WXG100 family type VII secretion target n=1 Tax=Gordonia rubripertincta TaxID=36822 RepID=A0ABT4N0Q6_GORRU|nr:MULTISPECIES: hypothetical protein [Mycobacteriales]MCZ4552827.1 hypothetical protein [Gordonia rubripertincta]OZG26976.1 hypothetical protein BH683_021305 [Williamsia sp. 1138]